MVKQNAVVSVSDSNVPQQVEEYGKYSNETIETFVLEDDCMTSLQLAHLKGVRHSHLLRDIRKMEETWVEEEVVRNPTAL